MAVWKKRRGVEVDDVTGGKNAFVSGAGWKKNEMLLRRSDDCQRPLAIGREGECFAGSEARGIRAVCGSDVDLRRCARSVSPFVEQQRLAVARDVRRSRPVEP